MVSIDDAVKAWIDKEGSHFEILVDPEKARDYTDDEDIRSVLATYYVFKDADAGKKASEERMKELFGTDDHFDVAEKIIKEGKIQLTTEQKRKMREQRRKEIANLISRRAINPRSGNPHPPKRILNVMDDIHFNIDPFKSAEDHLDEVVKKLRPKIPLSFQTKTIAVKVPPEYSGKAQSEIRDFGDLLEEEWGQDGSWIFKMEIPGGMEEKFYEKLNKLTEGNVETKIVEDQ